MRKFDFRYSLHIVFFALSLMGCSDRNSDNSPIPFDSLQWKNGDRYLRGRMSHTLIADSLLIHKTSEEVLQLLGEAEILDSTGFVYLVNLGDTGPLGLGGPWQFTFTIEVDPQNDRVYKVTCRD
jgi:hypothetical protein